MVPFLLIGVFISCNFLQLVALSSYPQEINNPAGASYFMVFVKMVCSELIRIVLVSQYRTSPEGIL